MYDLENLFYKETLYVTVRIKSPASATCPYAMTSYARLRID